MLPGPLVFVDVDTQRDFLEPTGALYIAGSEAILANLARLTEFARTRGISVLATACAHSPEDPELAHFPPHCLAGTAGQRRVPATLRPESRILSPDMAFEGSIPEHLTLEKREYDVFSRPDTNRLVAIYDRDRPTFVVYGVATDYCVKACVEGFLKRDCRVAIVVDAIWPIDHEEEPALLTDFVARGATLLLTDVVCQA